MPRIEGRKSTRKTVAMGQAQIETFALYHEYDRESLDRLPCCIEGCDRMVAQDQPDGPLGRIVVARIPKDERQMPIVIGWACDTCTERITSGTGGGLPQTRSG